MQTRLSGLLSYFTRHKTAANLLLVLLIAVGVSVIPKMRAQFFPDVIVDNVRVNVSWDGAGADSIDDAVVAVLEPALLVVEGVTGSSATSREGSTRITLEFEPGWNMSKWWPSMGFPRTGRTWSRICWDARAQSSPTSRRPVRSRASSTRLCPGPQPNS